MTQDELSQKIAILKPAFEASLDPVCVVDQAGRILYFNVPMKGFLAISVRELKKTPVFSTLLKLMAFQDGCQVIKAITTGQSIRLDETPAQLGQSKLRILFRATPLLGAAQKPIGAIVSVRDTTGEILLQAKYHKLAQILEEKEMKLADLEAKLQSMRNTMRIPR